jgi:CRP-like cAMP-binding protein
MMSILTQKAVRNRLLSAMSEEVFDELRPYLDYVTLPGKTVLVEQHSPTAKIFFIESGLASVIAVNSDQERIEVCHIGTDGMSASHLLVGSSSTPNQTAMQVGGGAYAIAWDDLEPLLEERDLRTLLLRYHHCLELQVCQSALANGRYTLNQRLARWLLMCHDRLTSDDLPLTHEFLGRMLGVRRSGVTNEIHILEGLHLIKANRGTLRVLDRAGLIAIAGGSYGAPEREYDRLIGTPYQSRAVSASEGASRADFQAIS